VTATLRKKRLARKKRIFQEGRRRIRLRLENVCDSERDEPMMTATNIHYEHANRVKGLGAGGIGAVFMLARAIGLIDGIDRDLHLLKRHLPYHESDHVLNIAFNIVAGGQCMEHLELRRNDEVYLDALGAKRIPDPTTEGDFCRRFTPADVLTLIDIINDARLRVWRQQPAEFFEEAFVDADGTLVPTDAECKQGVDIDYKGDWGYQPLLVSLANTAEPLYLVNRSGNRPSHEQADVYLDKAADLCRQAGFRKITMRGDTDFTQTKHLDRWDDAKDVRFIFGFDAHPKLVALAEDLAEDAYSYLERRPKYQIKTVPRQTPERVKAGIVQARGYETVHTMEEWVAEFDYRPLACQKSYRLIVVRKRLEVEKGQLVLLERYRYFFYITNDRTTPADEIVFLANGRCNQENLIAQLKGGVKALTTPVDNLVSNWAYMVMASLAWSLKAWSALLVPVTPRHAHKHQAEKRTLLRMEFTTYCAAFIQMPCQIVRSGRRLIYRFLSWNPWQSVFLRLVDRLHGSLLC
jgi:hypothetical protein